MKGVTLATFRQFYGANKSVEDLKRITDEQWHTIFKKGFWDKCKADEIKSQSVANLLVDFAYHSGPVTALKKIQAIVGTSVDGISGPKTIAAINKQCKTDLFGKLWNERESYLKKLGNYSVFGKGWMNRLQGIGYGWLRPNVAPIIPIVFKDW